MVCTFWPENWWRCSTVELFPSSGSHKHSIPMDLIGQGLLGGIKQGIFLYVISFNCYDLRNQVVAHAQFFPWISSCPMFQDPMNNFHFNLNTCPWKIPGPTLSEMHSKQSFNRLGKLRVKHLLMMLWSPKWAFETFKDYPCTLLTNMAKIAFRSFSSSSSILGYQFIIFWVKSVWINTLSYHVNYIAIVNSMDLNF